MDPGLRRDDNTRRDGSVCRDDNTLRDGSVCRDDNTRRDGSVCRDDNVRRDGSVCRDDNVRRDGSVCRDDNIRRDGSLRRYNSLRRDSTAAGESFTSTVSMASSLALLYLESCATMVARRLVCSRVNTHGYPVYRIPPFYDSLIAKTVVHGSTRAQAIERMRHALARFCVAGVHTTLPYLQSVLASPTFGAGRVDTQSVDALLLDFAAAQAAGEVP